MSRRRDVLRLAVASLCGGVVGFGAESVHQRAGVWELVGAPHIPSWIVGVYAPCLFIAGLASMRFERHFDLAVSPRRLALEACLFVGGFLAPVALHTHEWLLFALTVSYLATRLSWGRERGDVYFVLFVVLFDLTVEGLLVAASVYRYPHAQQLPLPIWLGPLWGGLAVSLRRFLCALGSPGSG